jgi:hypothetical protein
MWGYAYCWMSRLEARIMLHDVGAIPALPYVLAGVISAALVEAARLIYHCALLVLGPRQNPENLAYEKDVSTFDSLRQRTWKVVTCLDGVRHDIDALFSRFVGIHSIKEIRDQGIVDRDLDFLEIFRKAFWEQVHEMIQSAIPDKLGLYLIEAIGYKIVVGHLGIGRQGLHFLSGLICRMYQVRLKKNEQREEEARRQEERELENKVTCDLLAYLYPNEFIELEAREKALSKVSEDEVIVEKGVEEEE